MDYIPCGGIRGMKMTYKKSFLATVRTVGGSSKQITVPQSLEAGLEYQFHVELSGVQEHEDESE